MTPFLVDLVVNRLLSIGERSRLHSSVPVLTVPCRQLLPSQLDLLRIPLLAVVFLHIVLVAYHRR